MLGIPPREWATGAFTLALLIGIYALTTNAAYWQAVKAVWA
jgi:hypothetical protein